MEKADISTLEKPDISILVLHLYLTESWVIGHCRKRSFNCLSSNVLLTLFEGKEVFRHPSF